MEQVFNTYRRGRYAAHLLGAHSLSIPEKDIMDLRKFKLPSVVTPKLTSPPPFWFA